MRTQDELDFGAVLEVLEGERFELVCDCGYRQTVHGLGQWRWPKHEVRCHDSEVVDDICVGAWATGESPVKWWTSRTATSLD